MQRRAGRKGTRMTARHIVLIGVLAAALAGCTPKADDSTAEASDAGLAACGGGACAFAEALCGNQRLAALDGQIREALTAEAAAVSDAGAQMLAQGQQRWLEAQRVACGVVDPQTPLTADQSRCLESALRERAVQAQTAVQEIGGYTFQSVEIVNAQAVSAQAASESGLGDSAPTALMRDIRFPRIDGAATPQAQRFNQLVAQQPQYRLEDQTEEQVDYEIVYAGPELISVKFDFYESTLGAAHPNNSQRAVTVVMTGEGRALAATDVFRAGTGWEDFITRRSVAEITRQFRDYQFEPPARDVRESATKPHLWLVTERGLTILFPPYSFGGPHALGGAEVTIPWADLRRYLNPNAPQPIRASA
jgi:hypothetical protein